MVERALCILALLLTLPESRPCFAISEIPVDREQVYERSDDTVFIDSNGTLMDALIYTTRRIRYTGTAFIVTDTLRVRAGNPYPYHREIVVVERDSSGVPPRELDFCNYADSIDTVLAFEGDSLYVAFMAGERGPGSIRALFSLQEGLLYHGSESRLDEEGVGKIASARSLTPQSGIFRAARRQPKSIRGAFPGFAYGKWYFGISGRRLAPGRAD